MSKLGFTICLKEDGISELKRVVKIVSLSDGGFSIFIPRHKANTGYLAKHQIIFDKHKNKLVSPQSSFIEYSADNKVKISFHKDGFVQFSSEVQGSILSGKDDDGNPKGLGLYMKKPLYDFIRTGPTFGISIWGLNDYENATNKANNKNIIFNEEDYYYWPSLDTSWNTYSIDGFLFPCSSYWSKSEYIKNERIIRFKNISYMSHFPDFKLRVFRFYDRNFFIGILVRRIFQNFHARKESGFMLQSPRDLSDNQLMAFYPPFDDEVVPSSSLNYLSIN